MTLDDHKAAYGPTPVAKPGCELTVLQLHGLTIDRVAAASSIAAKESAVPNETYEKIRRAASLLREALAELTREAEVEATEAAGGIIHANVGTHRGCGGILQVVQLTNRSVTRCATCQKIVGAWS